MEKLQKLRARMRYVGTPATAHSWLTKWVHWVAIALLIFATVKNGDASGALFHPAVLHFGKRCSDHTLAA